MIEDLPQESEQAGGQYSIEQIKSFKQIYTNAIYFRLVKVNREEDILKFLRAMLAQGNDAVMGF